MAQQRRETYIYKSITVNPGATDQLYNIDTALIAAGRAAADFDHAHHIELTTDVAITFKINSTSGDEIPLPTSGGFILEAGDMDVRRLYFTHTGASSGSGAATVKLWAD